MADDKMNNPLQPAARKAPWRHHTVPKVLLRSFANERGRVWTSLVAQQRIVELSIEDASVRGGFNTKEDGTAELEHFFANEIEGPFGSLVAQGALSIQGAISSPSTKRVLSLFFLSQFLRVAGARAAYRGRAAAFISENIGPHHKKLKRAAKDFGQPYGRAEQQEVEESLRSRIESPDLHIDFTKDMVLKHAPELAKRTWRVFQVPVGRDLVLSDAPAKPMQVRPDGSITILEYQGVARPDVTLFMPLSPFMGLLGTHATSAPQFDALVLNKVTAIGSTQIYASGKEALLELR